MTNETDSATTTNGFHLVVDALKLNGLDTMYGVAGIPVTDLARLVQAEGIRYIGFHHEQSAGNAAAIAGYLTQKPGICLTVSAPGFSTGWWPGQRHHEWISHDPDQRFERAGDHRPSAG
jgi:oxalyl-CoA decarboxylase